MFLKTNLLYCIVVTLSPVILHSFMNRLYMCIKMIYLYCLVITLIAGIVHSFLNGLHMFLKTTISCSFAGMAYSIMNELYMFLKSAICCCLVITVITGITYSFMSRMHKNQKKFSLNKFLLTYFTTKLFVPINRIWWSASTESLCFTFFS